MQDHPLEDKASLSQVRRLIRAEFSRLEVDASDLFDCLVAVTEACTRALTRGDSPRRATVRWEIRASSARFYVRDYAGKAWARASHPSGRYEAVDGFETDYGLEIMRGLMDEVDVDVSPGGTVVRLVKRFSASRRPTS